MKLIYSKSEQITNRATAVTASSENANYPASNLLLGQASKVFRSSFGTLIDPEGGPVVDESGNIILESYEITTLLTVVVPSGVNNAIGVFGINSTAVTITVKNTAEDTTYFTETFDTTPASPARTWNKVWKEWTSNGYALHIIVALTSPATMTYNECGEIVVGTCVTIPDPQTGLGQGRDNYQVIQRLTGGGRYVHDGAKPRSFDLGWIMTRETEFDDLDEIYDNMGENPVAMLLSDSENNDMKWCGYFHMNEAPTASHDYPSMSTISLSISEAI